MDEGSACSPGSGGLRLELPPRGSSRLLILRRPGRVAHARFRHLPLLLRPGDCLVLNRTRVLPWRLVGRKPSGGRVEFLLLGRRGETWEALGRSGGRLRPGSRIFLEPSPGREGAGKEEAVVEGRTEEGRYLLRLPERGDFFSLYGRPPLPPYVKGELSDPERYQTVYAEVPGSLAAPTAGLHFTPHILARLRNRGVNITGVVLHLGPFSFLVPPPLPPPPEEVAVGEEAVETILRCRESGGRVVAVGTSTVRALETAALSGEIRPFCGPTSLYITPGFRFRVVDGILTNFHYSGSYHLELVAAWGGEEAVREAYEEARRRGYRFYSFGDAMLLL